MGDQVFELFAICFDYALFCERYLSSAAQRLSLPALLVMDPYALAAASDRVSINT
jgi:hypothetical protein